MDPAISPDGRTIAYAAGVPGNMHIFVRPLAGGPATALVGESVASAQRWPQWSPDGQRILFQAGRTQLATHPSEAGVLLVAPATGGTAHRMTGDVPDDIALSPAWSPDARRIAFAGPAGLYIAGTASGPS
jgi:Tol biopolymer transport system component